MVIKKDTIRFKTKFYTKGNEQTVEQLLKTIPGLNIDAEGTIKVGNQEIEKLMIDGDDLFEKGYKILSKNMPAYPIEEVELLKNYSNNRLLKGIENSNKVALNLKLKEKAKRVWFGNTELSYGFFSENRYDIKGNLMNFGKINKYYFLVNGNNTGYDITGDIKLLVKPFRFNEPASIGDNQGIQNVLDLSPLALSFKRERTNFNNVELLSLNAIFNPTKKLKIKTIGFFNWDEVNFYKKSESKVLLDNVNFLNIEDLHVKNNEKTTFGKIDIIYNISKTKMLEATTKYNNGNFNDASSLIFNETETVENLNSENTLFDQKINYTQKFNATKAFLVTGRVIHEKTPQSYQINKFFYEDLFPGFSNATRAIQTSTNQMQFIGLNIHLLDKIKNKNLLELQIGNEYRKDKLQTVFSILNDRTVLNFPKGYQNETNYNVNDLYFKGKYEYKLNHIKLIGKAELHQLSNTLETKTNTSSQAPFFISPSVGFIWKINKKNSINSSYSYNVSNSKVLDVYSDYNLTSFRSFNKGTGAFNQLASSSLSLSYQLGNWSDRFFSNFHVFYTKNHDFFTNNIFLNQNYTQSEKILVKDRVSINANANLNYYFKAISSNLKLKLNYIQSEYKNKVNNSDLRSIKSNNYNYGFELRSGFKGRFNYHFGTKWMTNEIKTTINNSFTNSISFLDLSIIFNDKLNIQLDSERYNFGNLQTNATYYFLDFNVNYEIKKNKLTLGLVGKNLFDTKKFNSISISDIGSSTSEYRLLPRFMLLKLEYRF